MKNYVQEGRVLSLIAPAGGVTSGIGVLIGAIFAIAACSAAETEEFEGAVLGVFDHVAATHATTQAASAGDPAYWDDNAKKITVTAAGNTQVGVFVEDKVSTVALARIALVPRRVEAGAAIADIALAAVTGVDGTGSNAASKADVDARFTTTGNKINAIIASLEAAGINLA